MLKKGLVLVVVALFSVIATYLALHSMIAKAKAEVQALQSVVTTTEKKLLGHTSYTTYLTAGKEALSGQMKLLAATVTRDEGFTRTVQRSLVPGMPSKATVALWHTTEYSFGYNLEPDKYDLRSVPEGIEIRVKKPALVATPAVSNLRHGVLNGGALINEQAELLKLTEEAAAGAKARGDAMVSDPAVVALCEKRLVDFLSSFLAKQPGVQVVPRISVVYI